MRDNRKMLAVFGGTFNPVHFGHINSAKDLMTALPIDELRMIPCHWPTHRVMPDVSSSHRAEMLALAVNGLRSTIVDLREIERQGPSYTYDTLRELQREHHDASSADLLLYLVVGGDAFTQLNTWHKWRDILALANVIVLTRPGHDLPRGGVMAAVLNERLVEDREDFLSCESGAIYSIALKQWSISATQIRESISRGILPVKLMPKVVAEYIREHDLYGFA